MDVSVVIPVYNEEQNIAPLLREVGSALEAREHEIIVVDGNSSDSTVQEARESGVENLRVIERGSREGIGRALQQGISAAKGRAVVQMDADFSHPPELLPRMVEGVESGADVVVGSRYVEGGERKDPLHRRIFPLIGSYLYRFGLGSPVSDVTSGFKAYSPEAAEMIAESELPSGFHFQAASLFQLVDEGFEVEELAIEFRPRRAGEPKYGGDDLLKNLGLFLKLVVKKHQRFFKFGSVGAVGMVVNMSILFFLTEYIGLFYLASSVFAVESAIISNFLLNENWTFGDRGRSGVKNLLKRFSKFNLISLAGMAINLVVLAFMTEVVGIYYLLSNLIAIGVVFLWNYTANINWTWKG